MNFLHIMPPSKRMMFGYIYMLRENFNAGEHRILYRGVIPKSESVLLRFDNTIDYGAFGKGKRRKYKAINKEMKKADHIILHGMNIDWKLLLLLFMHPKYLDKCSWVIWGIDLYNYIRPGKGLKTRLMNYIDTYCRKRIGTPIAVLEPDIDVYHKLIDNREVKCAAYPISDSNWELMDEYIARVKGDTTDEAEPSADDNAADSNREFKIDMHFIKNHNGVDFSYKKTYTDELNSDQESEKPLSIIVGNNAHSFNKHIKTFNQLKHLRHKNIMMYIPISYGNDYHSAVQGYTDGIVSYASELYPKEKYEFMTKLIPQREYTQHLMKMDIGIYNAERQNALGNINKMLYMGKKVYLSDKSPLYKFYISKGFEIHNITELDNITFEELKKPIEVDFPNPWIKNTYSREGCAHSWKEVFDWISGKDNAE